MAGGSRTVYTSYLYGLPNTAKNDLAFTVDSSKALTLYLHNNSHNYFISLKSVFGLLCMNNYTVDVQVGPPGSVSRYLHRSSWYSSDINACQFYHLYMTCTDIFVHSSYKNSKTCCSNTGKKILNYSTLHIIASVLLIKKLYFWSAWYHMHRKGREKRLLQRYNELDPSNHYYYYYNDYDYDGFNHPIHPNNTTDFN